MNSQSDLNTIIRGSELVLTGLSVLKLTRSESLGNVKTIEKLCIKNKLAETITIRLSGKDEDGEPITKELIIPKDGKECLFSIPKGIYNYEIELPSKEIFKKGEYKFDKETTITISAT